MYLGNFKGTFLGLSLKNRAIEMPVYMSEGGDPMQDLPS